MATAIAVGSLLSSGAFAAGSTATIAGLSMGTIASGLSIAGTALSGFQQFRAAQDQADAAEQESRFRAREIRFESEQRRTQAALEEADRERRLRRLRATQTAQFGASGIDPFSGSPVSIGNDTVSQVQREQSQSDLLTELNLNTLKIEEGQTLRAGEVRAGSFRSRGRQSLLETGVQLSGQIGDFRDVT